MRRIALLIVLACLAGAWPARAEQPRCPLDVKTCLQEFAKMKTRPWMGIVYDTDSTGSATVLRVVPGGPAEQAGIRAGDVLVTLEGLPAADAPRLLAGKAGWRVGATAHYRLRRRGEMREVPMQLGRISDEQLAELIGEHMVEAHLAYAGEPSNIH